MDRDLFWPFCVWHIVDSSAVKSKDHLIPSRRTFDTTILVTLTGLNNKRSKRDSLMR